MVYTLQRKALKALLSCSLVSEKRLGICFDQPVLCRNCSENIHDKYLSISTSYPEKSVRLNYFLQQVNILVSWTALIMILL